MYRATATIAGLVMASTAAFAQGFGTEEDVGYASEIWQAMVDAGLAGEGAVQSLPYEGIEPHGLMLETFFTSATIDGHDGALVIKRNYGPEGVTADEVLSDRMGHLAAVTIMFRRANGYDDETGNWFYAKYLPDGSLEPNPAGVPLAGLVGKGGDAGCIPCHAKAGGDDYLYTTDAELELLSIDRISIWCHARRRRGWR